MKKITLLAGLVALATVLLADIAFAEHSPEHVYAGSDGSAHEDGPSAIREPRPLPRPKLPTANT